MSKSDDPAKPKGQRQDRDYSTTVLPTWLQYETWTPKEAICLFCDLDPLQTEVAWEGLTSHLGTKVPIPRIIVPVFLHQDWDVEFLRDPSKKLTVQQRQQTVQRILKHPSLSSIYTETQLKLEQVWNIFVRDPKNDLESRKEPSKYVSWADRRAVEIRWLEWAKSNGYLSDNGQRAKTSTPTDKTHRDDEISELHELAVKVAVRLKLSGMGEKYITVSRVAEDVLKEEFSDGRPITSRWRKVEGVRSHLKNEHNPLASERFRRARVEKQKFNS